MRKHLIATVSAIALAAPIMATPVLATDAGKTETGTSVSGSAGAKTDTETTTGQDLDRAMDKAGKEVSDAYKSTVEAGKELVESDPEFSNKIIGKTVRTTDGTSVGEVKDVITAAGATRVQDVVIGTGGVLGMGEKEIAIPADQFRYDAAEESVIISMTEAEFETLANASSSGRNAATSAARGEAGFSADMAAIVGKPVHSQDGKEIGEVKDVVLGQDGKQIDQIVIGSGGVLGLGEKEIAVKPMQLRVNEEQKAVILAMTEAQFKQALEADTKVIR
ncbi:MAG: PRC-barrel domain-containing protein [Oceanibaculum nanhaiense]|uniref:PRC-barrel domain-containing protein n=1 Tax=Oceanibaculum nanhaiense TaxID=1909734 RepID=UPI0025A3882A|nr:PRC-barrel domain-containing protein [Oceanibaculum nanhaiense]MDM7945332.1 PRC-barrel domain-containing protein [Oceanibaculum nanhaiense]